MAELETGAVVAGRYVVVSLLGVGGMGAVYRVRDSRDDELYAVKVLRDARGDLAARFLREARIVSALSHPNIARVHEVLELDDGTPAIAMELLSGESLGARLARVGKLAPFAIARIGLDVVSAIRAAHERGVVHRDLKPDNIFLCDDGRVLVLDFGIAKVTFESPDPAITAAELTETGQLLGTPQYMAPEQIFGEKEIDGRADIWALGVILYQAVSGVRPFEGSNPGQVFKAIALDPPRPLAERAPNAPAELVALVDRMLVHARAERLADLDEVTRALGRVARADLGEADTLAMDDTDVPLAKDPPRAPLGRRRRSVAIGVASALAIAALAVSAARPSPAPPAATNDPPPPRDGTPRIEVSPAVPPSDPVGAAGPASPAEQPAARPTPAAEARPAPRSTKPPAVASVAKPAPASSAGPESSATARPNRSGALKRDEF